MVAKNRILKKWLFDDTGCNELFVLMITRLVPVFPFIMVVTGLSRVILWALRVDITNDNDNVTEEEIMSMVNEGHEQGVLKENEAEMIGNIFEFGEKHASDVMTHRKSIVGIEADTTVEEAFEFIMGENYSRYPVYDGDIDNIIGILHIRDLLKIYSEEKNRKKRTL